MESLMNLNRMLKVIFGLIVLAYTSTVLPAWNGAPVTL
jgi:hypothetical protein